MSVPPVPAVFLSYASQDALAARRLAEALRAAGVEVWFDQNELVGGDAWDAKIRAQIAACSLFVPLISAATQARLEGYFRLEWRLAEQRSHLMAKGRPFLLPVVLDSTREPEAQVPDSFREIQWTRLNQPGSEASFVTRVRTLLERLQAPVDTQPATALVAIPLSANPTRRRLPRFARLLAALLVLGATTLAALILAGRFVGNPPAATTASAPPITGDTPELRRAAALIDFNAVDTARVDFDLAEQILDRELARDPTHPRAVTLYAWLQNSYFIRGFDDSDQRLAKARRYSELALQLAPDDPEAIAAAGFYLFNSYSDLPRAEQLLRRAIELNPREPKYHRLLGWSLAQFNMLNPAHSLEQRLELRVRFMAEAAAAFPKDPLVRYDLAMVSFFAEDYPRALAELDAALALQPISTAFRDRAWMALWWEGRPADMTLWLDRTPDRFRGEDLAIIARYVEASVTGRFEPALSLLRGFPSPWLREHGELPKNFLVGDLLLQQGKPELARVQFEAALADIARARVEKPSDVRLRQFEAWTLLRLGRLAEARALLALLLEAEIHLVSPQSGLFWFGTFQLGLLLDDLPSALRSLRSQATTPNRRQLLRNLLRFDPRLTAWREHSDLHSALAEPPNPPPPSPAAAAPDASVAVLAFANLSSDPENEYFSDGVSEELLNVLAKIPGLKVSARTSAFHFKGKDTPVPEIARQLGVAHVVEGSVRKSGAKVRITAQLIRAADGFHVWSETYDRDLRDIFAVQDEIAALIVRELRTRLAPVASDEIAREISTAARDRTANLAAYDAFLEGRFLLQRRDNKLLERAIARLSESVRLDPDFALGWATLGFAHAWSYTLSAKPYSESIPLHRAAAERAVTLAPDLAEAQACLGDAYTLGWDWPRARAASARALALAPNQPDVLQSASWLALCLGEIEGCTALVRRALDIDPYNVGAFINLGFTQLHRRQFTEAETNAARIRELEPGHWFAGFLSWQCWVHSGRYAEAWADALVNPYASPDYDLALYGSRLGRASEADAALARALASPRNTPFALAQLYAFRGEADLAFHHLVRAREIHESGLLLVKTDLFFASLHPDPRWPEFLRTLGLADDQLAP